MLETICDELTLNVKDGRWSNYALGLLSKMQQLASQLGYLNYREDAKLGEVAWITVKGTPVPLDEEGNITGKVAEKIKATSKNASFGGVTSENVEAAVEKAKTAMTEPDAPTMEGDFEKEGYKKNSEGHWVKTVPSRNVSSSYGSPYPIEEISADGENKPCKGFSPNGLKRHKYGPHKKQYAHMSEKQYEEHAIKLLQKKSGPDIWGYRSSDGSVCRFNRLTGEYAKGYPGGDVKTCFYPTAPGSDPLAIDVQYARDYFMREKGRDSYDK